MGLKQRRSFEVTVCGAVPQEAALAILPLYGGGYALYPASFDPLSPFATCDSAKRLADWAFEEHGALSVRHEYDCRLSDEEA